MKNSSLVLNFGFRFRKLPPKYPNSKKSDVFDALDMQQMVDFLSCIATIRKHREEIGRDPDKSYVVVGDTWPMYEDTWAAIEQWVDNKPTTEQKTDD